MPLFTDVGNTYARPLFSLYLYSPQIHTSEGGGGGVRSKETIEKNKSTTKVERGPTLGMRLEMGIRGKSQVTLAHINTTEIAPEPPGS